MGKLTDAYMKDFTVAMMMNGFIEKARDEPQEGECIHEFDWTINNEYVCHVCGQVGDRVKFIEDYDRDKPYSYRNERRIYCAINHMRCVMNKRMKDDPKRMNYDELRHICQVAYTIKRTFGFTQSYYILKCVLMHHHYNHLTHHFRDIKKSKSKQKYDETIDEYFANQKIFTHNIYISNNNEKTDTTGTDEE